MEEDEEVVTENSPFFQHLQCVGFDSVEVKSGINTHPSLWNGTQPYHRKQFVDKHVLEAAEIVKSTNLLFEDDLEHVNSIYSSFQEDKHQTLKHMLKGSSSAVVAAFGLFSFLYIGYFAFFFVSLYYIYRTTEYLWQKHRQQKRLKRLVAIIVSSYSLFCRVIKFLIENESLLKARLGKNPPLRAWQFLSNLKQDLMTAQRDVNGVLSSATSLLLSIPLNDCIDRSEGYICLEVHDLGECDSFVQLHNLYMLLQSQFLTRFLFSIVPGLVGSDCSSEIVDQAMLKIAIRLRESQQSLQKKFNFALRHGICFKESALPRSLPTRSRKECQNYTAVQNIRDLSNSFQYLLIRTRDLETAVESNKKDPLEDLEAIQSELTLCQQHIQDILIMGKKMQRPLREYGHVPEKTEDVAEGGTITELGYPDLDPHVDDDVFEAIIDDSVCANEEQCCNEEVIDPLARRKQRELLKELKSRLKEKALDWTERESKVLERKGLAPSEPFFVKEEVEENSDEIECKAELLGRKYKYRRYGDSSSDEDTEIMDEKNDIRQNFAAFGQALQMARGTPAFGLDEDSYCGSGLNSDEEDS